MPLLATDRPFGHELLRRIRTLLDSYPHQPMMVDEVYLLRAGESQELGLEDGVVPSDRIVDLDDVRLLLSSDCDRRTPGGELGPDEAVVVQR